MAESTIKGGIKTFSLQASSAVSSGSGYGMFDALTGKVSINFNAVATNSFGSGTTIFTVPEAYRPPLNANGSFVFITTNNTLGVGNIGISTNGNINQGQTSGAKQVMGVAEWKI